MENSTTPEPNDHQRDNRVGVEARIGRFLRRFTNSRSPSRSPASAYRPIKTSVPVPEVPIDEFSMALRECVLGVWEKENAENPPVAQEVATESQGMRKPT